tara:strand:+ start:13112 stop:14428 length:1317 start_codon:yes stop_codon:yes gene_type:complete
MAQEGKLLNSFQTLFFDVPTGEPIIIVNDSLLYCGYDFKNHSFTGLDTEKPHNLWLRYIYSNEDKTLIVASSCGPVYQFEENDFKRLDNSFPHRNQYGAGHFLYNNTPHLFGGYGLFTFKNLITKFNFNTGEWEEVKVNSKVKPEPRREFLYHQNDSLFYVINGLKKDPKNPSKAKIIDDNRLWKLDLNTMMWKKAGTVKQSLDGYFSYLSFTSNGKWYLVGPEILELDVENNTFRKYKMREWKRVQQLAFDESSNVVTYIYKATSSNNFHVQSQPLDKFIGELIIEDKLFKSNLKWYILAGTLLTLLLTLLYYNKTKKQLIQPFRGIVYHPEEDRFYFKKQAITNLEENEHKLFKFLSLNKESFIQLNDINHLFNGDVADNYVTISKRREVAQAELLLKLSILLNVPKEKILQERKSPKDKRIKEIKLAPGVVKFKS